MIVAGVLGGAATLAAVSVLSWRKCILTRFYGYRLTPSARDAEWIRGIR